MLFLAVSSELNLGDPHGSNALYYVLAAVGIFTLLVGAAVRLRRPRDQATLHFFWLCRRVLRRRSRSRSTAGSIGSTGSSTGRDACRSCCCRRCSCTSRWCSPSGRAAGLRTPLGTAVLPLLYVPAALLGLARVVAVARGAARRRVFFTSLLDAARSARAALPGGVSRSAASRADARVRATCARSPARASCGGSCGARRSARCRSRSATRCRTPSASTPSLPMELSAIPLGLIPLAFASAIVRYRLMDVEVIVKRALVYSAALAAIVGDLRRAAAAGERRRSSRRRTITTGSSRSWRRWSWCCWPAR